MRAFLRVPQLRIFPVPVRRIWILLRTRMQLGRALLDDQRLLLSLVRLLQLIIAILRCFRRHLRRTLRRGGALGWLPVRLARQLSPFARVLALF